MNDIVYVYKQSGDGGQELKHSLRSLCNITHGKIFVVGDREDWFSDHIIHIPAEYSSPASMVDTSFKWLQACNDPRVSDDFYAFNDDFFITEPTTIPVLHANETDNLPISRHHNVVIRANAYEQAEAHSRPPYDRINPRYDDTTGSPNGIRQHL